MNTPATEDERERLIATCVGAYRGFLAELPDTPTGLMRGMFEYVADSLIEAGFRLRPTPSVEEVADVIAPWLSSTPQDPHDWQKQRATRIATAVIALLGGEG